MSAVYRIPDRSVQNFPVREEYIEKKSRFIASLFLIKSRKEAEDFLQEIRDTFPDAGHHCFAWAIGDPRNPQRSQCSDDGEPSGTAGRPILGVLAGGGESGGYGNTLIVVSRYFGGIKLGTGGLVRAYSAASRAVVEKASYIEYIAKVQISISFSYPFEQEIRHICTQFAGDILAQDYQQDVNFLVEIDKEREKEFCQRLLSCTSGTIAIKENTDKSK